MATNAKNKTTDTVKNALNTFNSVIKAASAAQQASKDKKNAVGYSVADKKQSTSKNVIQTKK